MVDATESHDPQASQPSLAELVQQLSEQTSRLAHQEVELAKAELTAKGKRAGIGAGMFGGAGVFGLYGLGALIAAGILALATAVAAWLAALVVACVLGAIAGVLALRGLGRSARRRHRSPSRRPRASRRTSNSSRLEPRRHGNERRE